MKKKMIHELDSVVLERNRVPRIQLKKRLYWHSRYVSMYKGGAGYEVEFLTLTGKNSLYQPIAPEAITYLIHV